MDSSSIKYHLSTIKRDVCVLSLALLVVLLQACTDHNWSPPRQTSQENKDNIQPEKLGIQQSDRQEAFENEQIEERDGIYEFKPYEVNNLANFTMKHIEDYGGVHGALVDLYVLNLGRLKKVRQIEVRLSIDIKDIVVWSPMLWLKVAITTEPLFSSAALVFDDKQIIHFGSSELAKYSTGVHEIHYSLTPTGASKGMETIAIDGRTLTNKERDFKDQANRYIEWGLFFTIPPGWVSVESIHVKSEKYSYLKPKKGQLEEIK